MLGDRVEEYRYPFALVETVFLSQPFEYAREFLEGRSASQTTTKRSVSYAYVLLCVTLLSGVLFYTWYGPFLHPFGTRLVRPSNAAIIDELSGTVPDPFFLAQATAQLKSAGYNVDYYSPSQVTVDLFKRLPTMGYGVVLFRAHSTGATGDTIAIMTSEPYSPDKFVSEQLTGQVVRARLSAVDQDFFAVSPKFVRDATQGVFPSSIILMMGCTGLANSEMAEAFVSRGAQVYVSWDQVIYSSRTDMATLAVLQSLAKGKTLGVAVGAATYNIPPDPVYNSQLGYFPRDQGGLVLTTSAAA